MRPSCRAGTRYFASPKYLEQKGAQHPAGSFSRAKCALKNIDAAHHDFELVALQDFLQYKYCHSEEQSDVGIQNFNITLFQGANFIICIATPLTGLAMTILLNESPGEASS